MCTLRLEPVLVGDVLDGNGGSVRGSVAEGTLSLFGGFGTIGIFQHTLFLSGNAVFGFVTATQRLIRDFDTDSV